LDHIGQIPVDRFLENVQSFSLSYGVERIPEQVSDFSLGANCFESSIRDEDEKNHDEKHINHDIVCQIHNEEVTCIYVY